ncbi:MAG: Zinc chelation protein SecC [Bryobacterales bacterium]|nr:Zinc chelation protein SecC [Bryobacterales bacterium]
MTITLKTALGPAYDEAAEQLEAKLQPGDILEVTLAAQIIRAVRRLQRCETAIEPDTQDIDRLRQRAELSIRRNLAELRQLQADRQLKLDLHLDLPGIIRVKDVVNLKKQTQSAGGSHSLSPEAAQTGQPSTPNTPDLDVETLIVNLLQKEQDAHAPVSRPAGVPTLRKPPTPGRNEPCPCGSGVKFKRCHGLTASAPPLWHPQDEPAAA